MPGIQAEFTLIDRVSSKLENIQKKMIGVSGSFQKLEDVMQKWNTQQNLLQGNLFSLEGGLGKLSKVVAGMTTAYLGLQKIQQLMDKADERTKYRNPSQRTFANIQESMHQKLFAVSEQFYQEFSKLANLPIVDLVINKMVSIMEVLYKVGTRVVQVLYAIGESLSKHWEGVNFLLNVVGVGLTAGIGKMILMNTVMGTGLSILQKMSGFFLGFNKWTLIIMGVAIALQGIVTLYNRITGSSVTVFGAIAGVFTALGEYFKYIFETIEYRLLTVYDILAKGVNLLIAGGNFIARMFHKEGTHFQMKVFDMEQPPNWIQFAKNTKKIAGDTVEKYSKGIDLNGDTWKLGSLDQNVRDIRGSLFHIEDTLLQDLIAVATSNAIANPNERPMVNNITVNNEINNNNTTGENAMGVTQESVEKIFSNILRGGLGI